MNDRPLPTCDPWSAHDFHKVYYGVECQKCQLFFADEQGPWAEPEPEEEHSYCCCCEECLQNSPERDILYGDGDYFNYGDED